MMTQVMKKNELDQIIKDYLTANDTDYAIMINGEWGSGKSYYIKHGFDSLVKSILVPINENENQGQRWLVRKKASYYKPAYISLYGVSSVEDFEVRVFYGINSWANNGLIRAGVLLGSKIGESVGVSSGKKDAKAITYISKNRVLVFDDLERICDDKIPVKEVLGLINSYVEHSHFKVVVVCNENHYESDNILGDVKKDYRTYKEKSVRFTHTIKADISKMVVEFAKGRNEGYSIFIIERKDYIASIYKKGNCSNLRTLKYNLDIYEHIFDIIGKTIRTDNKQHVNAIANYMLLLSMVYSIEYRRDNDEAKLKSLAEINRQWSYQIDTLDSLSRQSENKKKPQNEKSEEDKIIDYQRHVKKCYFANSYIYGSSMPLIEYLLTGYYDEDALGVNILSIEAEARRYETSEEKRLYQELIQFWETDDDVMREAVRRTLERVREGSFLLQDYPLFFLALQRLQNFRFIDLKMSIPELQEIFDATISKFINGQYIEGLDAYYYQSNDVSTPEYVALVNKVRDINAHNNQKNLRAEFETIVRNVNSTESLDKYERVLTCLFKNIGAEQFFELFTTYHNNRKHDYWIFFDKRYDGKDFVDLDREFIDGLRDILNKYLSDTSIEASGTRMYCSKILELLEKKIQQFGGYVE